MRKAALILVLAVGCKAPPLPRTTIAPEAATIGLDAGPPRLELGAGDLVHVGLLGHPELSSPEAGTLVDPEGRLALPLLGAVPIDGLTASEAAAEIRARFASFVKEPDVTLSVLEYGSRRFYLFGQVEAPGAYVLDRPLNALQGLALGGGFAEGADRENVCLLRIQDGRVEVHVFDGATPDGRGLVSLHPDDFLFVRQSGAGSFKDQILPIVQGVQPLLSALINIGLVADAINN